MSLYKPCNSSWANDNNIIITKWLLYVADSVSKLATYNVPVLEKESTYT